MGRRLPSVQESKILQALLKHSMYGLEISRAATVNRRGIYVVLGRMVAAGYITRNDDGKFPQYQITDVGKRALKALKIVKAILD